MIDELSGTEADEDDGTGQPRQRQQPSGGAGLGHHVQRSRSGVPITDELADKLAEEAERGYDLSLGRPVGRKSLAGGSGHSPRLNFRTTRDLYERASARAQREGKTVRASNRAYPLVPDGIATPSPAQLI
jgi:hypothetical protein